MSLRVGEYSKVGEHSKVREYSRVGKKVCESEGWRAFERGDSKVRGDSRFVTSGGGLERRVREH